MEEPILDVRLGPPAGGRATLSKASRRTLQALYRHPIAHNLEWADVLALFKALGTVHQKSHGEVMFGIGGERHRVRKPHSKDITVDELLEFRRILTQAGWSSDASAEADASNKASAAESAVTLTAPNLLVVVEHQEARIYHLDLQSADPLDHAIKPYDPHHFLHHLTQRDLSRRGQQRASDDPSFYRRLAEAVASAQAIVVIGHGAGHGNAADGLVAFLRLHHPETFARVTSEAVADLSRLTPPQLLVLGRRALSSLPAPAS